MPAVLALNWKKKLYHQHTMEAITAPPGARGLGKLNTSPPFPLWMSSSKPPPPPATYQSDNVHVTWTIPEPEHFRTPDIATHFYCISPLVVFQTMSAVVSDTYVCLWYAQCMFMVWAMHVYGMCDVCLWCVQRVNDVCVYVVCVRCVCCVRVYVYAGTRCMYNGFWKYDSLKNKSLGYSPLKNKMWGIVLSQIWSHLAL